jgi:hypothetical protein
MRVIPFPTELLDDHNPPRCFHDGKANLVPCREVYALAVIGGGEVRAVCSKCTWRYCDYCNHAAHRCLHCGTVADHFERVCPECVAEFAAEEKVEADVARWALNEAARDMGGGA